MSDSYRSPDVDALNDLVAAFGADRRCRTISWGIVVDGRIAARGTTGDSTDRTIYRIASMTKSFSSAATLMLRDEGVLRLDDRVADHAPELSVLDRHDSSPVSIRDLLTMTSGLPSDDPWADRHLDLSDDEFDRIIASGPVFAHPAGNTFEYSNFGFAVLGRVIHRITGRRIQEIVSERLLGPLGMLETTWTQPDHDDWARPMRWLDSSFVDELPPLGDGLIAPMGGLWTNVDDLATWVTWLDDGFPARADTDGGLLSRASRREMQSPQRYSGMRTLRGVRSSTSYGFGLRILDEPDLGTVVTHSGGLPGYGSNMRWLPGRRIGAIALANATYAPMTELTARLLDHVNDRGIVPRDVLAVPAEVRDAADRLVALLTNWDDDSARSLLTASLLLDDDLDRRRTAAAAIVAETGPLHVDGIEARSGAAADVTCRGASGRTASISLMLAPPSPPRVQSYTATIGPANETPG